MNKKNLIKKMREAYANTKFIKPLKVSDARRKITLTQIKERENERK